MPNPDRLNIEPTSFLPRDIPFSPEDFVENARKLVELFERGPDPTDRIGGWHGTSLEAIERSLIHGAVPGSAIQHLDASAGHLFFFPNSFQGDSPPAPYEYFGRSGAEHYAKTNAQTAFVLHILGLEFGDARLQDDIRSLILEYGDEDTLAEVSNRLMRRGLNIHEVQVLVKQSFARKGVVISLSAEALEQMNVSDGDVPGEDRKLFVPEGLPLSALVRLEALGAAESRYFEILRGLVSAR